MFVYSQKAFNTLEWTELETMQFGIKLMHAHFDPIGQFRGLDHFNFINGENIYISH